MCGKRRIEKGSSLLCLLINDALSEIHARHLNTNYDRCSENLEMEISFGFFVLNQSTVTWYDPDMQAYRILRCSFQ